MSVQLRCFATRNIQSIVETSLCRYCPLGSVRTFTNRDRDMKTFGWAVLALGIVWTLVALNMDVTVAIGHGEVVNNIGLMASRQNHIIIGVFIGISGLLVILFGKRTEKNVLSVKCPFCAEPISPEAIRCKHCGSDVAERLDQMRKANFNPAEMRFDIFFIRRKSGFEVNKQSIITLVAKMKESYPDFGADELFIKYQGGINHIKNQLPSGVRAEFERELKSQLLQ